MEILRHERPGPFLSRIASRLESVEARHNLLLGVVATAVRQPDVYPRIHLWTVEEGEALQGVAAITPPHNLILGDVANPDTTRELAGAVFVELGSLPGVVGNRPAVDWFVDAWTGLVGATAEVTMAQRVFALEEVSELTDAPGSPRAATDADRPLLIEWVGAFHREATPGGTPDLTRIDRTVGARLEDEESGFWIWEGPEGPSAFSGYGGRTPNGIRIGPVYTPPRLRGRGYATSLVARQSRWLLDRGMRFCFLYTDLANPTANAIYRRIGYRPVADSAEYRFRPDGEAGRRPA